MRVIIKQSTEEHVRGDVVFLDANMQSASRGYFFAEKVNNGWKIVLEGNGEISCQVLREHNFPNDMMDDCAE